MKKKNLVFMLLIIFCFFALPSLASAAGDLPVPDAVYSRDLGSTDQFLVKILRPEGNETAIKKSYITSGSAIRKNVIVQLLRQNDEGNYERLYNTEERSNWKIGPSGIFMKEIKLNEGPNRIRIAAFVEGEEDNLQISDFVINLLPESVINTIFNIRMQDIFRKF